jgi:uncharacterized protein (TIGR04255 family)
MSVRPDDLPNFTNPPLIEAVLSVQFGELPGYRTVHAGLLWNEKFRSRFPTVNEQPNLPPTFELFGMRQRPSSIQIKQWPGPEVPRLWFIANDESRLVQIQHDRIIHNWRKTPRGETYPRYEHIRPQFFGDLDTFRQFCVDNAIGEIQPNQCEVTYVNDILPIFTDDGRIEAADAICGQISLGSITVSASEFQLRSELKKWNFQAILYLPESKDQPFGRLHVSAEEQLNQVSSERHLRLTLTARGAPRTADDVGVGEFFDIARIAIVRTFAAITTTRFHEAWGRTQ